MDPEEHRGYLLWIPGALAFLAGRNAIAIDADQGMGELITSRLGRIAARLPWSATALHAHTCLANLRPLAGRAFFGR